MTIKCTWLFNGSLANESGSYGFSETWYYPGTNSDNAIAQMDRVSIVRAQIMSGGTRIVGYRVGQDGGRAFVVRKSFLPPGANGDGNLPVDSCLCQLRAGATTAIKKFWLHDLPDSWIGGNIIIDAIKPQIRLVIASYVAFGFQVRYQVQGAASADILSIDAAGAVTTVQAHGLAVGNYVSLLKCRDIYNRPCRGVFVVTAVPTPMTLTLAHWIGNTVARKGRIRLQSFQYADAALIGIQNAELIRAGARKVGRPFFSPRGRAAARR